MVFIKQYGLYRTGTNYLQWLLSENFKDITVLVHELGFKHGQIPDEPDWEAAIEESGLTYHKKFGSLLPELKEAHTNGEIKFVFCIKNPYSWLASYTRYRSRSRLPDPENIRLWNDLNQHWWEFHEQNPSRSAFVRYEDLVEAFEKVLEILQGKFDLTPKHSSYVNTERVMDKGGHEAKAQFDPSFYLEKRYLEQLPDRVLKQINELVSDRLMQAFGYDYERRQ